jgi:hypothetical protein
LEKGKTYVCVGWESEGGEGGQEGERGREGGERAAEKGEKLGEIRRKMNVDVPQSPNPDCIMKFPAKSQFKPQRQARKITR